MLRLRSALEAIALVLVIVVCVAMLGLTVPSMLAPRGAVKLDGSAASAVPEQRLPVRLPREPLSIHGSAIKGDPNARVAVVGYSDYQCPFCVRFATETLPELDRAYFSKGKAFFVFKHLPITSIHPQAVVLAEAAECAGQQGRFWPMHDRLFANSKQADLGTLVAHSEALRLDLLAFEDCMRGRTRGRVDADVAEAAALGITGTPTFFLGIVDPEGRVKVLERVAGARPLEVFTSAIDRLLNVEAPRDAKTNVTSSGDGGK